MINLKKHIIIIDDNPAIHDDIKKILNLKNENSDLSKIEDALFDTKKSSGQSSTEVQYIIESAYQGQEGINKVQESLKQNNPFHVAVVDMRMPPGIDGIQTIKEFQKLTRTFNSSFAQPILKVPLMIFKILKKPKTGFFL